LFFRRLVVIRDLGFVVLDPLTQAQARWHSGLPTYGGDRDRESARGRQHIAWLYSRLRSGLFHSPVWATVEFDGVEYRADGGHSSLMLSELSQSEFPAGVRACVRRFSCDAFGELATLFDQIDPRRSARTAVDQINAHKAVAAEDLQTISATKLGRLLGGIAAWRGNFTRNETISTDARVRARRLRGGQASISIERNQEI
jgi:hypothetical protein